MGLVALGVLCLLGAFLSGFVGILVASDEGGAARPFFWTALALFAAGAVLVTAGVVRWAVRRDAQRQNGD